MKSKTYLATILSLVVIFLFTNSCSSFGLNETMTFRQSYFQYNFKIDSIPKELFGETISYTISYYFCPDTKEEKCYIPVYRDTQVAARPIKSSSDEIYFGQKRPEKWTHLSITVGGIEKVYGKYTIGHNPFWIMNHKSFETRSSLYYNFHFRSQENLIPNRKQEEIAKKFAPILVYHKDKKYLPSNIEKYSSFFTKKEYPLPEKDLRRKSIGQTTWNYVDFPDFIPVENPTHLYYHVRYATTTVSGTSKEALPGFRDNGNYWYDRGGDIVISYYIWYDWNEGPTKFGNVHQGDLESYALLISPYGEPKRILLTGHDHILLDTDFRNINSLKNHPILYVAKGNMGADGGNPTSAYGGYTVKLNAGNFLFNYISDPWDVFPSFDPKESILIVPDEISDKDLTSVKIGPGIQNIKTQNESSPEETVGSPTIYVDARRMVKQRINKLVMWEEPGWVNQKAFQDPDGHHNVDKSVASFFQFQGRLGKHPRTVLKIAELKQFGASPENAPFKTNIEQHFTFERPQYERSHTDREGNYGPKFYGDDSTPQK
ncbi:hypothetical protein AB3N60_01410 [Leptospira sp. WS39.C2]